MGEILAAVAEDEPAARSLAERTRAVARLLAADIERLSDEYPRYDRAVVAGLFHIHRASVDDYDAVPETSTTDGAQPERQAAR